MPEHDKNACDALKFYNSTVDALIKEHQYGRPTQTLVQPFSPYLYMKEIAERYNTTVEAMKEHWRCLEREGLR